MIEELAAKQQGVTMWLVKRGYEKRFGVKVNLRRGNEKCFANQVVLRKGDEKCLTPCLG
jgi:hypothetical protein